MRWHAGVRIAGLVVQASLQNMLTWLRRQVRMQNELARVDAELLLGSKLKGILGTRREVDRAHVETRRFDHRQPSRNQRLLRGRVGIDVQPVGHAKVKIDLGGAACGNTYLRRIKELDGRIGGSSGKGGSLITCNHAASPAKTNMAQRNIYLPPAANAFLMLASTSSFETNPAVSATIFPSRPTK